MIFGQNNGYDHFYDTGYPDYFHVLIFDESSILLFESGELDVHYREEFWETGYSIKAEILNESDLKFTIVGFDPLEVSKRKKYSAIWNGSSLRRIEE